MKDILLRLEKKEKMEKEKEETNEPNKDSPGKRIGAERVKIQRRGGSDFIFSLCISLHTDTFSPLILIN